ncbi:hypothetical protein [Bifidobacterium parmae]|uniref:Uncharacterized protein n=1 Tax=Bifidobacterium parmae TaxID=361854 RepID=A0A2N5J6N4_9BIFI|nr:hypothetical protein [Bifidobacterium parmae]PLS29879.1 hypothetical protein Uis4E_0220 [Bifidobacterium parmae]
MRIYDYYETGDGTRVTHSDVQPDGSVLVFFDKGDKHAEVRIPDGTIPANTGFSQQETNGFLVSTVRGMKSIMRYAREGGIQHAWTV